MSQQEFEPEDALRCLLCSKMSSGDWYRKGTIAELLPNTMSVD
ncbi:hypothetical protein CEXT_765791, partial [Caerostris extrusa]